MNFDEIRKFCLSLPGTTEGIKWEEHLCFMIAEKMFLIINIEPPHSFALKINSDDFDFWTERQGITQAGHMAKRQWIEVQHLSILSAQELSELIITSRQLVLQKLPKKIQAIYSSIPKK